MAKTEDDNEPGRELPKASTADVLGGGGGEAEPAEIDPRWQDHYRRLNETRNRLLQQRESRKQGAQEIMPAIRVDNAEAATTSFDSDLSLTMLSADQAALYEIEQAMARIRLGSYGICELTGKPISSERLEAIPWTRFSKEAVRELEQRGETGKVQLGELGDLQATADDEKSAQDEDTDEAKD